MGLRAAGFAALYLGAVMLGRATRIEGTQLALVWPAAGVAFLWFAVAWRSPVERRLTLGLLFATTIAGNLLTGTSFALALAFAAANLAQAAVGCAVFARLRPTGWTMTRAEDLRALLFAAVAGSIVSAAIGPVAVWLLTTELWPVAPASWILRNASSTLVVAGLGLRLFGLTGGWRAVTRMPRRGEFLAVTVLATAVYGLAFGATTGVPLAFLVVPLSIWVALRYDTVLAALHGGLIAATLIVLTLSGHGPFALQAPQIRVMLAQAFIGVISSLTLVLALHRDERQELLDQRRRGELELASARDAALEASDLKSAFLANMSHEIRTPMNGVIGMTELLLDGTLAPRQRTYAEHIRSSAETLLAIINDILDVSKIEAGKLEIDDVAFSLREAVADARALLGQQARRRGIELRTDVDNSVPELVAGDPIRVRQILTNLTGNAIKFTERGHVAIHVASGVSSAGPVVTIRVEDTGVGIAPDVLPRLFDPFEQADAATTRRFGGTGLGLAISRELAELMGGRIEARSQVGRGSVFTVTLPLPATTRDKAARARDAAPVRRPATAVPVLLAEDNAVNRLVAAEMLRKRGLTVEFAVDGREAVAMAGERPYAAVFMDCQMPELDGFGATAALRGAGATVPIIAMTANAMRGDRERCLAAGMDDYLAKPVRAEELDAALARWLPAPEPAAPPAEPETPTLDPRPLTQLGNPELVKDVVALFMSDADRRIGEFTTAARAGAAGAARSSAHALAGSAAGVGAARLAALARAGQHPDTPPAFLATLSVELQRTLEDTRPALTALAAELAADPFT
jgi:signal transduction histidine kinase/ActR/RegA family two-component response regulator